MDNVYTVNTDMYRTVILGVKEYTIVWSMLDGRFVAGCQPDGFWFEVVGFGATPREAVEQLKKEYDLSLHMC